MFSSSNKAMPLASPVRFGLSLTVMMASVTLVLLVGATTLDAYPLNSGNEMAR